MHMDAVVVVMLENRHSDVVGHNRRIGIKLEREPEGLSENPPETTTEREIDDEVGRRVDHHQQLADGVEDEKLAREDVVREVPVGERDDLLNEFRCLADDEYRDDYYEDDRRVLVTSGCRRTSGGVAGRRPGPGARQSPVLVSLARISGTIQRSNIAIK